MVFLVGGDGVVALGAVLEKVFVQTEAELIVVQGRVRGTVLQDMAL